MTLDPAMATAALPDGNFAHCETQLKQLDRATWLASLFADADRRPALHAIEAFVADVRGVRDKVREPLAGELRMQWWTDAIEGETRGDVRGHPIASALLDTIRLHRLSRTVLTGFIDVERDALYDETIETLKEFDDRADRTDGALIGLKVQVLVGPAEPPTLKAARHAGRVIATVQALRGLALARPLVTVPLEMLRVQGIGTAELKMRRTSPAVSTALATLRAHALEQMNALRLLRRSIAPGAAPAFLTANIAAALIGRASRQGFDPFTGRLDLPQWRKQWILWRAAGRNGVL